LCPVNHFSTNDCTAVSPVNHFTQIFPDVTKQISFAGFKGCRIEWVRNRLEFTYSYNFVATVACNVAGM